MTRNIIHLLIFLLLGISPSSWPSPENSTDHTIYVGDTVHFERDGYEYIGEVSHVFANGRVRIAPHQHATPFASFYRGEFWGDVEDFSKRITHFGEISENDEVLFEQEGYNQVGIVTDIFSNGRVRIRGIQNAWGNSELIERHFWRDAEDVSKRVNHLGELFENDEIHAVDEYGYDLVGTVIYLFSNGKVRIALSSGSGFIWAEADDVSLTEMEITLRREREERERSQVQCRRMLESLVTELHQAPITEHRFFQRLIIRVPQGLRAQVRSFLNILRAEVLSENNDIMTLIISGSELRHLPHMKWNIRLSGAEIIGEDPLFEDQSEPNHRAEQDSHHSEIPARPDSERLRIGERSSLAEEPPLPALSRDDP